MMELWYDLYCRIDLLIYNVAGLLCIENFVVASVHSVHTTLVKGFR